MAVDKVIIVRIANHSPQQSTGQRRVEPHYLTRTYAALLGAATRPLPRPGSGLVCMGARQVLDLCRMHYLARH